MNPGDVVTLSTPRGRVMLWHEYPDVHELDHVPSCACLDAGDVALVCATMGIYVFIITSHGDLGWTHVDTVRSQ